MESSLWFTLISLMVICHTLISVISPVTGDSTETTKYSTKLPETTEYSIELPETTEYSEYSTELPDTTKTVEIPDLFYPFGPDHGDAELPTALDDSEYVPISATLPFFTSNYNKLYVSTNGIITFKEDQDFTPEHFPLYGRPMVASFWADMDIRDGGCVFYRETIEAGILSRATNDVRGAFPSLVNYTATWVLIATWYEVAEYDDFDYYYYNYNLNESDVDMRNTHQAVLITDEVSSFCILNYGDMMWTTGSVSGGQGGLGGTEAQAGVNAGDGVTFFTVDGAMTEDILDVASTTNVGIVGRWMFGLNNLTIQCFEGNIAISSRRGSFMGGYEITLSNICLDSADSITCTFDKTQVTGRVVDSDTAACVVPFMFRLGRIPLELEVNGVFRYAIIFTLTDESGISIQMNTQYTPGDSPANFTWDSSAIDSQVVDIELLAFQMNGDELIVQFIPLELSTANDGSTQIPGRLLQTNPFYWVETAAVRIRSNTSNSMLDVISLWSDIHECDWYIDLCIYEYLLEASQISGRRKRDISPLDRTKRSLMDFFNVIWSKGAQILEDVTANLSTPSIIIEDLFVLVKDKVFEDTCLAWSAGEVADPALIDTTPCPCDTVQMSVLLGGEFESEPRCHTSRPTGCASFHPGAHECFITTWPSPSGAGQQCCYDSDGKILPFSLGGGTHDRAHHKGAYTSGSVSAGLTVNATGISGTGQVNIGVTIIKFPKISHVIQDVSPFIFCCQSTTYCDKYSDARPTDNCKKYIAPRPGWTNGDPHLTTLDGLRYTFNGKGEFIILEVPDVFTLQGRAEPLVDSEGDSVQATVWTAFVAKSNASDTVQVQLGESETLDVLINTIQEYIVNGEEETFDSVGVKMSDDGTGATVTFENGINLQVTSTDNDVMNIMIVVPHKFRGVTVGLLGNYDDIETNDFQTPGGDIISHDASLQDIYYMFGIHWMVSEEDSIFNYTDGQSYSTFKDTNFTPIFELTPSEDQQQEAEQICGDSMPECIYDYLTTGRESVAIATKNSIELYEAILNNTQPVVTCGFLNTPSHGQQHFNNSFVGAIVLFTCDDGYKLEGSTERTCEGNGEWSGNDTKCVLVTCGFLNTPSHGQQHFDNSFVGAIASFTCDEGYKLKGSSGRTCQSNGVWSGKDTKCVQTSKNTRCIKSCTRLADGDYQSCKGCHVYASCVAGKKVDKRKCPDGLVWDDVTKNCDVESSTCP